MTCAGALVRGDEQPTKVGPPSPPGRTLPKPGPGLRPPSTRVPVIEYSPWVVEIEAAVWLAELEGLDLRMLHRRGTAPASTYGSRRHRSAHDKNGKGYDLAAQAYGSRCKGPFMDRGPGQAVSIPAGEG